MSRSLTRLNRRRTLQQAPAAFVVAALVVAFPIFAPPHAQAKKRRPPAGGRVAVVVDERLAALREAPDLSADLVQRLGRGRAVSMRGSKASAGGVTFYRVGVTSRTTGWVQGEALASPARAGDDERLLRLIGGSEGFDRLERAAIFLETFPRSPLRPAALLLLGEAADDAARTLSREAARRLDEREMAAGGAPPHSYFLNFSGLDRYRRRGVVFTFDASRKQFQYDGAAWRELVRRHPHSPEAGRARARLGAPATK